MVWTKLPLYGMIFRPYATGPGKGVAKRLDSAPNLLPDRSRGMRYSCRVLLSERGLERPQPNRQWR